MIPTIDLSILDIDESMMDDCNNWLSERNKILAAFTRNGFIQVINHGVEMKHIDTAFTSARLFFSQSLEQKLAYISKDKARRGYSPMSTENFASLIGESDKPNDKVEKFRIGPTVSESEREVHSKYYNHKEAKIHFFANEWGNTTTNSDGNDGFQSSLIEYYHQMSQLSKRLLYIIERIVGLEHGYFEPLINKHTSILSLNGYPNLNCAEYTNNSNVTDDSCSNSNNNRMITTTRVAEHTDVSMLTIVAQSALSPTSCNDNFEGIGGLEVYDTILNQWLPVPYTPNAFIVNVGDCLSEWSRGLFKSSLHRVRMRSIHSLHSDEPQQDSIESDKEKQHKNDRISLAYFLAPNYDAVLDWPVTVTNNNVFNIIERECDDTATGESMTYTTWRKNRIKRAIQSLNKKA